MFLFSGSGTLWLAQCICCLCPIRITTNFDPNQYYLHDTVHLMFSSIVVSCVMCNVHSVSVLLLWHYFRIIVSDIVIDEWVIERQGAHKQEHRAVEEPLLGAWWPQHPGAGVNIVHHSVELETNAIRRFRLVSIVSYYSRPSLMIIASVSQFHVYLQWGQCLFSIVS